MYAGSVASETNFSAPISSVKNGGIRTSLDPSFTDQPRWDLTGNFLTDFSDSVARISKQKAYLVVSCVLLNCLGAQQVGSTWKKNPSFFNRKKDIEVIRVWEGG